MTMSGVSLYDYQNEQSDVDVSGFLDHLELLENKRKREDELRAQQLEAELTRMKTMSRYYSRSGYASSKAPKPKASRHHSQDSSDENSFDSDQENRITYGKALHTGQKAFRETVGASDISSDSFQDGRRARRLPLSALKSSNYASPNTRSRTKHSKTAASGKSASPKRSPRYQVKQEAESHDDFDIYFDNGGSQGAPETSIVSEDSLNENYFRKSKKSQEYRAASPRRRAKYVNDNDGGPASESALEFDRKLSVRARKYLANDEIDDLENDDIDDIIRLISPIARKLSKAKSTVSPYSTRARSSSPLKDKSSRNSRSSKYDHLYDSPSRSRNRSQQRLEVIAGSDKSLSASTSDDDDGEFYATARSSRLNRTSTTKKEYRSSYSNGMSDRRRGREPMRSKYESRKFGGLEEDVENEDPDFLKYRSAYNYEQSLNSKPAYLQEEQLKSNSDGESESTAESIKYTSSLSSYKSKSLSPVKHDHSDLGLEASDFDYPKMPQRQPRISPNKSMTIFDDVEGDDFEDDSSRDDDKRTNKNFSPSLFDLDELKEEPALFSLSQPNSLAAKLKQHSDAKAYLSKRNEQDELSRSLPSSKEQQFKPAPNISSSTITLLRKLSERQSTNFNASSPGSSKASSSAQFDVSKYDKNDDLNNLSTFLRSKSSMKVNSKTNQRVRNANQKTPMKSFTENVLEGIGEEEEIDEEEDNDGDEHDTTIITAPKPDIGVATPKNKMLEKLMSFSSAKTAQNLSPSSNSKASPLQDRRSRFETLGNNDDRTENAASATTASRDRSSSPVRDLINRHNNIFSNDNDQQDSPSSATKPAAKFSSPKGISTLASKFEQQLNSATDDFVSSPRSTSPLRMSPVAQKYLKNQQQYQDHNDNEDNETRSPKGTKYGTANTSNASSPLRDNSGKTSPGKSRFGTINKLANRYAPMPKAEEAISAGLAAKAPGMKRALLTIGTQKKDARSASSRYIPAPDSIAAISAAMAAKAPALKTQVYHSAGERDFSLADQSKFLKPTFGKYRLEQQQHQQRDDGTPASSRSPSVSPKRPDLDIEREIDLKSDNKLRIKVKENHWLGSAIQRSPTKDKQDILSMINEKPKFYESIQDNRKQHGDRVDAIPEEDEEDTEAAQKEKLVDYRNVLLKKVATPTESALKKDKLFDEIPDFVKLRNKKQAAANSKKKNSNNSNQQSDSNDDGFPDTDHAKVNKSKSQEEAGLLEFRNKLASSMERRNKFEAAGKRTDEDVPVDSLEIINKIRSKSPERLTQFDRTMKSERFRDVPEDSEHIINKIRSRSPERITQFEKNKMHNFREMPEDASEIINKIRSKSPQRISEFEKLKKSKFDNVPEDAMEIIKKIRKQN